jgi:hypothetical protein
MKLTNEEVQTLQDLWSNRETVNWAVYDRLKDRILRSARPEAAPLEDARELWAASPKNISTPL